MRRAIAPIIAGVRQAVSAFAGSQRPTRFPAAAAAVAVDHVVRRGPIGQCIYCGSTADLTDEHVVPYGLAGDRLILEKASCQSCARITSRLERDVLRGFMLRARTVVGLPTRRRKQRPKTFTLEAGDGHKMQTFALPVADYPAFLQLPRLVSPGFLTGRPYADGVSFDGCDILHFGKDPSQVAKELDVRTIQVTDCVDVPAFARMLAKIGYAFAVFERGPFPLGEVPVLPLILGEVNKGSAWVGSAEYQTEMEKRGAPWVLGTYEGTRLDERVVVARVKHFANAGAIGYEVVVRRWRQF
jgi:hypothetical protein